MFGIRSISVLAARIASSHVPDLGVESLVEVRGPGVQHGGAPRGVLTYRRPVALALEHGAVVVHVLHHDAHRPRARQRWRACNNNNNNIRNTLATTTSRSPSQPRPSQSARVDFQVTSAPPVQMQRAAAMGAGPRRAGRGHAGCPARCQALREERGGTQHNNKNTTGVSVPARPGPARRGTVVALAARHSADRSHAGATDVNL